MITVAGMDRMGNHEIKKLNATNGLLSVLGWSMHTTVPRTGLHTAAGSLCLDGGRSPLRFTFETDPSGSGMGARAHVQFTLHICGPERARFFFGNGCSAVSVTLFAALTAPPLRQVERKGLIFIVY